jgi:hypothetical protein
MDGGMFEVDFGFRMFDFGFISWQQFCCVFAMQRYQSSNKNTGVIAYDIIPDGISVKFKDGSVYLYTIQSTGKTRIAQMQRLAKKGEGLTTYINQHVRENYHEKLN